MNARNTAPASARGMTLLELLVAMTVGLILLAGVTQIFISSRTSYRLNEGLSRVQENGRFAADLLIRALRQAGYRSNAADARAAAFPQDPNFGGAPVFGDGGQVVMVGNDNAVGGDGIEDGTDTITLRYQGSGDGLGNPDNTVRDCVGAGLDARDQAVETFFVREANGISMLMCTSFNETRFNAGAAQPRTQPVVDGVENIQILLGEDTDGDNAANRYVPADFVGLQMNRVVSLRLSLLLRSIEEVATEVTAYRFPSFDEGAPTVNPNDHFMRREVVTTISLRNRQP